MKNFGKFLIGFLAIMILVGGGYFVWDRYFSSRAKLNRETQKNYEKYLAWQENYEKAMKEDTFGGKTPEETLQLFIEALKKEDVELASKYFALEDNLNDPDYLTRKKWEEGLRKAKEENRIEEIINILSRAIPTKDQEISRDTFWFSIYDGKGEITQLIEMIFNHQSRVWKIVNI